MNMESQKNALNESYDIVINIAEVAALTYLNQEEFVPPAPSEFLGKA